MERRERKSEHYIPQELWGEIFTRLPVETLLKFRCVCKAWCSLIESLDFASNHLIYHNNNNNNVNSDYLLVLEIQRPYSEIYCTIRCGNNYEEIMEIGIGFVSYEDVDVVGYVNGVLCLKFYCAHELLGIVLSNPSITRSRSIPLPKMSILQMGKSSSNDRVYVDVAFGFDMVKNEYKVLAMGYALKEVETERGVFEFEKSPSWVEVYAQSSGSWRSINISSSSSSIQDSSLSWRRWCQSKVFVNGAVHLGANDDRSWDTFSHVIAFDIATEVFSSMELPESGDDNLRGRLPLVYGESLGVIEMFETFFCIWVMKEYGVRESWVRQCKICVPLCSLCPSTFVCLKKDGDLLYRNLSENKLMACNIRNQEIKCVWKKHPGYPCFVGTYVESLLLLK